MAFEHIIIIYNPNSTGDSKKNAFAAKRQLSRKLPKSKVLIKPTKYAGHAEKIAYEQAKNVENPLILSSSGDGGYNEVVNGVMRAKQEGFESVTSVIASGNANDHKHALRDENLSDLIAKGRAKRLDLLKLTYVCKGKKTIRYAHSYIGLGITPVVAVELNKHDLHAFKEAWIVLKTYIAHRPFKIKHSNKVLRLNSLIFANIDRMAKILTLSKSSSPTDGKFEIIMVPARSKWQLIRMVLKASTAGLDPSRSYKKYTFKTVKSMPIQLDGEVMKIQRNSSVTIESDHKALRTIF